MSREYLMLVLVLFTCRNLAKILLPLKVLTYFASFWDFYPQYLKVDKTILQGKMFVHRISTGDTLRMLAQKIGIDVGVLIWLEQGKKFSNRVLVSVEKYLNNINSSSL